jgi:hypothetical protein
MRKLIYGLILVIVLLGGVLYLQTSKRTVVPAHRVVYRVSGEGTAVVGYQIPGRDFMEDGRLVRLPWAITLDNVVEGAEITLVALSETADEVTCSITVDERVVIDIDTHDTMAVCGGRT